MEPRRVDEPQLLTVPGRRADDPQLLTVPGRRADDPQLLTVPGLRADDPQLLTVPGRRADDPQLLAILGCLADGPQLLTVPGRRADDPQLLTVPGRRADDPQLLLTVPGRRALLCALGAALLLLLLLLAATCAASIAGTRSPKDSEHPGTQPGSSEASLQKELAYARLRVQNATLKNGTLSWYSSTEMTGVLLSENLSYNKSKHELVVAKAGLYYVFLQLKLKSIKTYNPKDNVSGQVSLTLHLQSPWTEPSTKEALVLTVNLSLKEDFIDGFQGRMLKLAHGHRLSVSLNARLAGDSEVYNFWNLVGPGSRGTVLGLFSVDPLIPADLFFMCSPCLGSALSQEVPFS